MGFISNLFSRRTVPGSVVVLGDNTGSILINGQVIHGDVSSEQGALKYVDSVGPINEQARDVKSFNGFNVGSSFLVEWCQGPPSAKIVAADNIQAMVKLDVSGERLSITFKSGQVPSDPVKVMISSPCLTRLELSGACQVSVGVAQLAVLSVIASMAASVTVRAIATDLIVKSGGSANVKTCFSRNAHIQANGASTVSVEGHGSWVAKSSGAAEITQSGGLCRQAKLSTSGASSINIQLDGNNNSYISSGASVIKCGLACGASIVGENKGASSCKKEVLSALQESEARDYGASADKASTAPVKHTGAVDRSDLEPFRNEEDMVIKPEAPTEKKFRA